MKTRFITLSESELVLLTAQSFVVVWRIINPQPVPRPWGGWHVESNPSSGYRTTELMLEFLPIYCPCGEKGDQLQVEQSEMVVVIEDVWVTRNVHYPYFYANAWCWSLALRGLL